MFRFLFRLMATFALAVAVIMAVLDVTRTVAASRLVITSLGASWRGVSPATLERLRHRQLILADAVARRSNGLATSPVARQAEQRIHVRTAGQLAVIPTDMIVMLSAEADFTRIITTDGHDYLVCRLLGQFEAELPTPPFFRVSRSLVVNLDRVERVRSDGGGRSLVAFGRSVRPVGLGRAATKRLRHILAESAWTVAT